MSADRETLAVYDGASDRYAKRGGADWDYAALEAFLARLPAGARILDLGCGPGHLSAVMAERGMDPDPVDASAGMVALARENFGLPARQATFDEIDGGAVYDAVWANFSLLHAPRAEMPGHLERLARALRPGGLIHLGMKVGEGEARDGLNRFYTYWRVEELQAALEAAGFAVDAEVRRGRGKGLDSAPFGWCLVTGRLAE
jgi:SAM-dependent methyltransferase